MNQNRKSEFVTLIHEDDGLNPIVIDALNKAGYRVDVVHPEVALINPDALGDIVITEIMFGEDELGPELVTRMHSDRPSLPIIVLSSDSSWETKVRMLTSGASDYLVKPFHREELLARVETQIRNRPQSADLAPDRHAPSVRLKMLAARLNIVCAGLKALRLNSINDHLEQLELIASDMEQISDGQVNLPQVRTQTLRVLPILCQVYDLLGSERGAQMIVSGAIAGLVSLGGWPAVTAYSLSVAAWLGKDAFIEAVKTLSKDKA